MSATIFPPIFDGKILALIGALFVLYVVLYVSVLTILFFTKPLYSANFDHRGKHVVVTGGSSGIGLEVAREYISRGSNVTIVARNQQRLDAALGELRQYCTAGQKVTAVSVDCASSIDTVAEALSPVIENVGDVDVLINSAGTSIAAAFDQTDPGDFEKMLRINVLGSIYPTRAVVDRMKRNKRGRIVFVSSQVAHVAIYGYSAYAASKWALRGLAESLQMELRPFNVYVSVAFPPDTDTPGYETEMLTKPALTKMLSESGTLFSSTTVARDIVNGSTDGLFSISSGMDGWLLKQLHPGMSPLNNIWEVVEGIVFGSMARFVSVFYLVSWDRMCAEYLSGCDHQCEPPAVGLGDALLAPSDVPRQQSGDCEGRIRYRDVSPSIV